MEPHSGLNDLDYIVIGVILLSGLLALMRGFLREVFSLIAWTGAYIAATKYYPQALPTAHHYIKNDKAAEWAAMAGVFVIALVILMILGALICSLIKGRALTAIDRSLGFLFGLARGVLVVSLVYMGVATILWPNIDDMPADKPAATEQAEQDKDRNVPPDMLMQAKTRPALAYGARTLKVLIPKELLDKTLKQVEPQKEQAEQAAKQKLLDTLSTPAPIGQSNGSALEIIPLNKGNTP